MLSSWERDHGVLRDRGKAGAPTPDLGRGHPPGVVAPGYGICICLVCPTPALGGAHRHPGFGTGVPMPGACPPRHYGSPPPPPPVHVCFKRGERYEQVDAARLDLDDHRVTLTPPGGSPLVLLVARANYDKARIPLVLVPLASGA